MVKVKVSKHPANGKNSATEFLRALPSVDAVLNSSACCDAAIDFSHDILVNAVRAELDARRQAILEGASLDVDKAADTIAQAAVARARVHTQSSLRRTINATGIVLHTNLGRAPLAKSAVEAVADVARGYSTLEYDTNTMSRGSRHDHCERLLCELTGAQAAVVFNNNAASVFAVLQEFACMREVVVSRGELIEIGGSFRIPDIMALSGAKMVEVGTTNKTHIADYKNAVTPNTAIFLKVHTSNYHIAGFSESVSAKDLHKLAQNFMETGSGDVYFDRRPNYTSPSTPAMPPPSPCKILVYEDLGSGALADLSFIKDNHEPTVNEALRQGCDLVSFSGDKLLGGPQAGIIVGRADLIARLKKNPFARVLRLDKMTLAALEATLLMYLNDQTDQIPTINMLKTPEEELRKKATALKEAIIKTLTDKDGEGGEGYPRAFLSQARIAIEPVKSKPGGGSLPMCTLNSYAVTIKCDKKVATELSRYLIQDADVAIIHRLSDSTIYFDVRTIEKSDFAKIAGALAGFNL